jgi:hypothetical protein
MPIFVAVIMLDKEISERKQDAILNRLGVIPVDTHEITVEPDQVTVDFAAEDQDAEKDAEIILEAVREIVPYAYSHGVHSYGRA